MPPPAQMLFADITSQALLQRIGRRYALGIFTAEGGILFGGTSWQKDKLLGRSPRRQTCSARNRLP